MDTLFPGFRPFGPDPFAELRRMQEEMNRAFSEYWPAEERRRGFPPVNLWVGEESVVVTAEFPGLGAEDVELTVREATLAIQGKRPPEAAEEEVAWHRRERAYGDLSRTVELPFRVDPDKVTARFRDGVLEVELGRPAADLPKKIAIKAG